MPNIFRKFNGISVNTSPKSIQGFRQATQDDLEQIVGLIALCHDKHAAVYGIPFDGESVVATALYVIRHGICLIGHGATAGATFAPFTWNRKIRVANIVFWEWTKPSGIRIFDALLPELAKRGATHLVCTSHFPDNRIGEFYAKKGMRPVEQNFVGEISKMEIACKDKPL